MLEDCLYEVLEDCLYEVLEDDMPGDLRQLHMDGKMGDGECR